MRHGFCLILLASCLAVVGCSKSANQNIEIKVDPMARVRTLLKGYSNGQSLHSEVTLFPVYVETVRKVAPAKADILEKGLKEIKEPGTDIPAKAKELMAMLGQGPLAGKVVEDPKEVARPAEGPASDFTWILILHCGFIILVVVVVVLLEWFFRVRNRRDQMGCIRPEPFDPKGVPWGVIFGAILFIVLLYYFDPMVGALYLQLLLNICVLIIVAFVIFGLCGACC